MGLHGRRQLGAHQPPRPRLICERALTAAVRAQMNQILEAVQTTFELQQEVDAGLVQMAVRDAARPAAQARCGTSD